MTLISGLDHMLLLIPKGCDDEARAYFTGVLGMPEMPKPHPLSERGGCWFQAGDQQLHVGAEPTFEPATRAHPARSDSGERPAWEARSGESRRAGGNVWRYQADQAITDERDGGNPQHDFG